MAQAERGMTTRQAAELLFQRGSTTIPSKEGDVFVSSHVISGSRFPYRISGEQEQDGQMVTIIGSSGATQTDALNVLPYHFRRTIVQSLRENKPE